MFCLIVISINWTACSPICLDSYRSQTNEGSKSLESICHNPDQYVCVIKTLDRLRYNGLNTKKQGPTECKALVREKCERIGPTYGKNYFWFDQKHQDCKQTVALFY